MISTQAPQYRQFALISDFLDLANLSIRKEAALATNWIKDRLEGLKLFAGEELKPFQSVTARFNFLAMDRPDLLYSVMRKMASPRTQDLTAIKRVARYTIKYARVTCRYPWTELECQQAGVAGRTDRGLNGSRATKTEAYSIDKLVRILRCLAMQTLLDAAPQENPQWEASRCGVASL